MTLPSKRRFFVPEVVQTSAMDCGPAVLKCVLEGYGIGVHYGRLREACQTDVDGTTVNALEETACQLGLEAEQVMLPVNHLLLPEAEALPCILVVSLPSGLTHFVLVWRRFGRFVQIMDPAVGRRWMSCEHLQKEIFLHCQQIAADQWLAWAQSDEFRVPLARRLRALDGGGDPNKLIAVAEAGPGWRPLARLDAATRLVEALVRSGGVQAGSAAMELVQVFALETAKEAPEIPESFWFAKPAPPAANGAEQVTIQGAVLVRVRGRKPASAEAKALSPELAAAVAEPAGRPAAEFFRLLGASTPSLLLLGGGLALGAGGLVLEAVLLRGALEAGRSLTLVEQKLQAIGFFLLFAGGLLFLELRLAHGLARLGRQLEGRLRRAFLTKIPLLNDRYMQSRPISDMAERSHSLQQVRTLPRLAGQFARANFALLITAAALAWIDPGSAGLACTAALVAIALPLAFTTMIQELDLRVRNHTGALTRFYLDALVGLAAVRAHGAQRALRREHEGLLVEWALANQRLLRWVVFVQGVQITVGFGLAGWLALEHTSRVVDTGAIMLLAYWALNLPTLGEEIAMLLRQYPTLRNLTLRLLEPLGAPEIVRCSASGVRCQNAKENDAACGVAIELEGVTVCAAGQTILHQMDLTIAVGSHVAIVGASGAGKSSLVGLLLGWHRVAEGRLLIDGEPFDGARLERLRQETAWVDPAVTLWNRSLLDNLQFGNDTGQGLGAMLNTADLHGVLERLPEGMQTSLGEGGGLVSGGEGQRVRFGRALARKQPRLVILDEPFRGLDREKRRELLRRARRHWQTATLLCITHDVGETSSFDRVLVLESGRILEDGSPIALAHDSASRYRALLDAEEAVRTGLWAGEMWKRLRLEGGRLA